MNFQWPYVLIALPFVAAGMVMLYATTQRARARLLQRFAAGRLLPILLESYSPALRMTKLVLAALGILLVVVALARPQWGFDWLENHQRGVDVVFVIDTSRSMLTPDVSPNRLERAKLAIYDCVQQMPGNRVGLVAFAGDAFLQCPLTLDYDAFRQSLDAIDTNTIARGGTDIATGLDAAAAALEKSGSHKIIVLLTDGEDLEGQGVAEAKTLADEGITIYTVGVGTAQGDIIPIRDNSGKTDFVRDQRGELVKSHLDATTLSDIANVTHGFYQPLGSTGEGLMKVYEEGIKKVPEQTNDSKMTRQPVERYQWPLAAGVLLLTLEMLLGTRRPAWRRQTTTMANLTEPPPLTPTKPVAQRPKTTTVVAALLVTLGVLAFNHAQAQNTPAATPVATDVPAASAASTPAASPAAVSASPKAAENLFEKGNFAAAAEAYGQAADNRPQDSRFRYNQGDSLYLNKDYGAAADAFNKALSSPDLNLQQQAYYNLGNAHFRLGQDQLKEDPKKTVDTWEGAVKDYQNAVDLNPKDADARYNLELTQKVLADLKKQLEQQQQQQQKQQQNQQDQQQQNQDQQNQNNSSQNQQNNQDQKQNSQSQQDQNNQQQSSNSSQGQSSPSQQNQNGQQNPTGSQNQSSRQNSGNQANSQGPQGSGGDQKQSAQNQGDQQNGAKTGQPQNQNGQQQAKSSQGTGQQNNSGQNPGNQAKTAQASGSGTGKEPNGQKAGQQTAGNQAGSAGAAGGDASGGDGTANGTVVVGMMTRDEAAQLLNSLKSSERKLPAIRVQDNSQNTSQNNQDYKDW